MHCKIQPDGSWLIEDCNVFKISATEPSRFNGDEDNCELYDHTFAQELVMKKLWTETEHTRFRYGVNKVDMMQECGRSNYRPSAGDQVQAM
jgi:hypothetical protein